MNNKISIYRIIRWVLISGALILGLIRQNMAPSPAREVMRYVGIALLVAAGVQMILMRVKPELFRDKVDQHPEGGID